MIDRTFIIRRFVRRWTPDELRAMLALPGPRGRAVRAFAGWLSRGSFYVMFGRGSGLRLSLSGIPLHHAHLGMLAIGDIEAPVQDAMIRHVTKGGVFYDIGANVGFFALLGAHYVGLDDGQVYAFEPAPDNAAEIRANVALNGLPNVTVLEQAVGAQAGTGRLQVVADQSWSKLVETGDHPQTERVMDIEVVAIDELVATGAIAPPTAVKIDVEGFEVAVLQGMRATLERHRPVVICELHGTQDDVAGLLRKAGYRLVNLEVPEDPVGAAGVADHVLAVPD